MVGSLKLSIVSAEKSLFSGEVKNVVATGALGQLEILPGHMQLITSLKPGQIHADLPNGQANIFYISGGILEVQPDEVSVLADIAVRAEDLDEAKAIEAKQHAEESMKDQTSETNYSEALASLAEAVAQLEAIRKLRSRA